MQGKAETDLATLGGSAGLAAQLFLRSLMGAQTAHFVQNAFHFELGFEALQGAIHGFAFFNLDFWHEKRLRLMVRDDFPREEN
jgi:hypothetical protein